MWFSGLTLGCSDWLIFLDVTNQSVTLRHDVIFVCVAQVLSRFQLTHEEIVERRKLMSEKGSPDGHKPVSTTDRTVQGAAQHRDRQTLRNAYTSVRKYDGVSPLLLRPKFPLPNVTENYKYHYTS